MKLNVGCGDIILPDYINVDLYNPLADVKGDASKLEFDDGVADEIYASHLIEHFDFREGFKVLEEWKRVLKVGGKLVLETPDFLESCRLFPTLSEEDKINMYPHFFATPWIEGLAHKFLYTDTQLRWTLEKVGFHGMHRTPPQRYVQNGFPHMRMECFK